MTKALTTILLGTTLLVAQQGRVIQPHAKERHIRNIR